MNRELNAILVVSITFCQCFLSKSQHLSSPSVSLTWRCIELSIFEILVSEARVRNSPVFVPKFHQIFNVKDTLSKSFVGLVSCMK